MNLIRKNVLSVSAFIFGMITLSSVQVASQTPPEVPRAEWVGSASVPSYVKMYIHVPSKLAAKPPIVVSIHACQSSVSGQVSANAKIKAAADKNGFIMIFPDNPGRNCWDVGSPQALAHDKGGDPHAIAQMVRYALKKYNADSTRVYAVGGSSGAMMTQALLGVYPEIFTAGAPRAGVACGCWAVEYEKSGTAQWSGPCASGTVTKTAEQWGSLVRAINPNYSGHRPRVMIFHGESDQTIKFQNFNESIKEWTNVLGLSTTPDSTDKISPPAAGYAYNRKFWKNKCGYVVLQAWSAPGQPHSMNYEEDAILKFFGLDIAGGQDPEIAADCTGIGREQKIAESHKWFFIKDNTLVLNTIKAEDISVKIVNTLGQIQCSGNYKINASVSFLSIPLSSLPSGYYIVSVVFNSNKGQSKCSNYRFVMTK